MFWGETRDIMVYVKMVNQHLPSLFSNATLKIYTPPPHLPTMRDKSVDTLP